MCMQLVNLVAPHHRIGLRMVNGTLVFSRGLAVSGQHLTAEEETTMDLKMRFGILTAIVSSGFVAAVIMGMF